MAGVETVSIPSGLAERINAINLMREKYEADCKRIYEQLKYANSMLGGELGLEVKFLHKGIVLDGFLLRGTPMEKSTDRKSSNNTGYLISSQEIFRNGSFDHGEYNNVRHGSKLQKDFNMHNFLVFEGDVVNLQKAIEISLTLAMPKTPQVTGLEKVELKQNRR